MILICDSSMTPRCTTRARSRPWSEMRQDRAPQRPWRSLQLVRVGGWAHLLGPRPPPAPPSLNPSSTPPQHRLGAAGRPRHTVCRTCNARPRQLASVSSPSWRQAGRWQREGPTAAVLTGVHEAAAGLRCTGEAEPEQRHERHHHRGAGGVGYGREEEGAEGRPVGDQGGAAYLGSPDGEGLRRSAEAAAPVATMAA